MKSIILAIFAIMVVTSAVESQVWTTEINMHPSYNVNDFFSIAIGNGGNLFITGYEGNASVSHLISTKISPSGQILWLKEDAAPTRITSFFSLATLNGKDKFVERYNVGTSHYLRFWSQNGDTLSTVSLPSRVMLGSYGDSVIATSIGNGSQGFIFDENGVMKTSFTAIPSGMTVYYADPRVLGDTLWLFGTCFSGGNNKGYISKVNLRTKAQLWTVIFTPVVSRAMGDIDLNRNAYIGMTAQINGMWVFRMVRVNSNGDTTWTKDLAPNGSTDANQENFVNGLRVSTAHDRVILVGSSERDFLSNTPNSAGYVLARRLNGDSIQAFKVVHDSTAKLNPIQALTFDSAGNLFVLGKSFFQVGATYGWVKRYPLSLLTGVSGNQNNIPEGYVLYQNYPNPFNPKTKISFSIPKSGFVRLTVYDILGREIETLVAEKMTAGMHEVGFDGKNLASGVYFYRLDTDNFTETRKMMLVK